MLIKWNVPKIPEGVAEEIGYIMIFMGRFLRIEDADDKSIVFTYDKKYEPYIQEYLSKINPTHIMLVLIDED